VSLRKGDRVRVTGSPARNHLDSWQRFLGATGVVCWSMANDWSAVCFDPPARRNPSNDTGAWGMPNDTLTVEYRADDPT
jgi:hypothetical protein